MKRNIDPFLGEALFSYSQTLTDSRPQYAPVFPIMSAVKFITTITQRFENERLLLGQTVKDILIEQGAVSNKAIILHLLKQLENCKDMVKSEILRSSLEIVVGITPDDVL